MPEKLPSSKQNLIIMSRVVLVLCIVFVVGYVTGNAIRENAETSNVKDTTANDLDKPVDYENKEECFQIGHFVSNFNLNILLKLFF